MANQINYAEPVRSLINQRPYRPTSTDQGRLATADKFALVGAHPKDNIEIWIYNAQGRIVGDVRLNIEDEKLKLFTVVSTDGSSEYVSIDMEKVLEYLHMPDGRYSMVVNILRDEVGSLNGERLFIEEISPSRTELRLSLEEVTPEMKKQLYEFTQPSVPRVKAQALLDQVFGKEIESGGQTRVNGAVVRRTLDNMIPGTQSRLSNSNTVQELDSLLEILKDRIYNEARKLLVEDRNNYQVQEVEFLDYIERATDIVLADMENMGAIDPRLELI